MYSYEVCTKFTDKLEDLCRANNLVTIKEGLCTVIQGNLRDLQIVHDTMFSDEEFDPIRLY